LSDEKRIVLIDIDDIKDPIFDNNLFDFLVIDQDIKSTIKSLALNNARKAKNKNENSFAADFIRGKGEGQVFLLHGPPGVGKTCAAGMFIRFKSLEYLSICAECVAELTGRPLLSITSGDLGTEAGELDSNLSIFFRLGELWKAIVVIGEADIYFEAREINDIARNSLVSGKQTDRCRTDD
jgi:DNA polymerase III delta prime subunit